VNDVSGSLYKLDGISKVEANLKDQLVSIEGTVAPSAIVSAIQATGRDAILRGSGAPNSAAVCILETHSFDSLSGSVKGLGRMVQVSSGSVLVDLTIRGLSPGKYWATVRETGDISQGAISVGGIWTDPKEGALKPRGFLGTVDVGRSGVGSVFLDRPIQLWEIIGRSMVVSKQHESEGKFDKNDQDTLVGVVARSAGVWDNDKTVCSCSGKTIWEEREDEIQRGML